MMAKIVKGSGARGIVDYILDKKKQATLIDCQGVLFNDNSTIAKSFIAQSRLNPRVDKFIGHISLSFSKQDLPRLTDEFMIQISREYMEKWVFVIRNISSDDTMTRSILTYILPLIVWIITAEPSAIGTTVTAVNASARNWHANTDYTSQMVKNR